MDLWLVQVVPNLQPLRLWRGSRMQTEECSASSDKFSPILWTCVYKVREALSYASDVISQVHHFGFHVCGTEKKNPDSSAFSTIRYETCKLTLFFENIYLLHFCCDPMTLFIFSFLNCKMWDLILRSSRATVMQVLDVSLLQYTWLNGLIQFGSRVLEQENI